VRNNVADVLFLVVTVTFFVIALGYVTLCDRLGR
jgi:hypothetical protein